MNVLKSLKVGHRINFLAAISITFIIVIGAIGYFKMSQIGEELDGITNRDIPLTEMLTKITIHQLEQAVMLEQILRLSNVITFDEELGYDGLIKKFKNMSLTVDDEIIKAEELMDTFAKETTVEAEKIEFKKVLDQLKVIEVHHKEYEDHAFEIIEQISGGYQNLEASQKSDVRC